MVFSVSGLNGAISVVIIAILENYSADDIARLSCQNMLKFVFMHHNNRTFKIHEY